jgi:hypothetical protein
VRFPELHRQYAKMGVQLMLHSFYNARQIPGGIHEKIMPPNRKGAKKDRGIQTMGMTYLVAALRLGAFAFRPLKTELRDSMPPSYLGEDSLFPLDLGPIAKRSSFR